MKTWLLILGGPLLWSAHFGLAYMIASISVVASGETTAAARALIVATGLIAALAALFVLNASLRLRNGDLAAFTRTVAATGAVIGAAGIVWTSFASLAPL